VADPVVGTPPSQLARALGEVLPAFLRLGVMSFGGPVAHLGYFREAFIVRRRWLDEAGYADLIALCQFLPGPASSQVGISLGLLRAGAPGAFCAWFGFTMPSAIVMILFGYAVAQGTSLTASGWLHGLKLVAVAVVAQAVWRMAGALCPDWTRRGFALIAAAIAVLVPGFAGQIGAIGLAALAGWLILEDRRTVPSAFAVDVSRRWAALALVLFFALLGGLPLAAFATRNHTLAFLDAFYRSGSLVFGGGHVVLPLLQAAVVPPGWVGNDDFLAGYGAAQAMPGPLFTFAAYLGSVMRLAPAGWEGGLIALAAIYVPSFLLIFGTLPLWSALRGHAAVRSALTGINAAVVGLLLAALYNPVAVSAIFSPLDGVAVALLLALLFLRLPQLLVVVVGAALGAVL
jgi:chromate transporter